MSFVAHGLRIGIRMNDPQLLDELPQRLPPGWRPASSNVVDRLYSLIAGGDGGRSGVRRYSLLYAGAARIARSMDPDEVLDRLEDDVRLYVAEWSRRKLFVHAGVVAWEGRAIVIPGRSYSGKSTLVEALVRAGATYFSDEYAVFDDHGLVHPYRVPLSLRKGADMPPEKVRVDMPKPPGGLKPLPVGVIAVATYRPGARWRPRPLSPGQAVLSLLANTVAARRKPEQVLTKLARIVEGTRVLRGSRGEAVETAGPLLAAVGS
ncbi:MAG: hypothetical protein IIC94_00180 [Chloroflexi bacterium]|nr:hypothetical protein [Chloroflexota bacterium]